MQAAQKPTADKGENLPLNEHVVERALNLRRQVCFLETTPDNFSFAIVSAVSSDPSDEPMQIIARIVRDDLPVICLLPAGLLSFQGAFRAAGAIGCVSMDENLGKIVAIVRDLLLDHLLQIPSSTASTLLDSHKTAGWVFDCTNKALTLSPALSGHMGSNEADEAGGLEAFFIALSGLGAKSLLEACTAAANAGQPQRCVHVFNCSGKAGRGRPLAEHIIASIETASGGQVLTGHVSNHVFIDDIESASKAGIAVTEDRFLSWLDGILSAPMSGPTGLSAAVLVLSIDRFEQMNILLGRTMADTLLDTVSERLALLLDTAYPPARRGDSNRAILCRLGGAQFAIGVKGRLTLADARALADAVLKGFNRPFHIANQRVHLGAHVGIATANGADRQSDKLLSRANLALYQAISEPVGHYKVFDALDAAAAQEKVILDGELRDAINEDSLFIRYMPIVRLSDRAVVGAEALIRWDHPQLGTLTPELFIPLAEKTGAITPVGTWVLKKATAEFARIASDLPDDFYIAINISSEQFRQDDFTKILLQALKSARLPAHKVMLEITESLVIEDFGHAREIMNTLQKSGIRWSIDDFGTGFSALSYLGKIPFDELKLDRSFVKSLASSHEDEPAKTLIDAVIAIAQSHERALVAEGIETEFQANLLAERGCKLGQGFYFSEPLEPKALVSFASLEREKPIPV